MSFVNVSWRQFIANFSKLLQPLSSQVSSQMMKTIIKYYNFCYYSRITFQLLKERMHEHFKTSFLIKFRTLKQKNPLHSMLLIYPKNNLVSIHYLYFFFQDILYTLYEGMYSLLMVYFHIPVL